MELTPNPDLKSVNVLEIKRMIPHRFPFLLIDRVYNMDVGKFGVGLKNVTANEPHFEGHFPAIPVMPGVLVIEAMAQTSAVLVVETLNLHGKDRLVYFMSIDGAKFRKPVQPGDQLLLHVAVIRGRSKVWKFKGTAVVDGAVCAEAEFTAMIMTPEEAGAES